MTNFKKIRMQLGFSQKEVAITIGVSGPTVSEWESGKKTPSGKNLIALSNLFGVSTDFLLGNDNNNSTTSPKGIKIPVLGRVAAGIPITAVEDILDYEEIEESLAKTGEFYGLQIKGTSMEPRMKEGDVVIVRRQDDVESGEIAIVLVNGDDATCKRVVKHENGLSLISLNPVFPPRFYTDDEVRKLPVQIIGRVVELRAKF